GAHVNAFFDMHDVGDALVRTGLSDPVLDVDRLSVTYADTDKLFADLSACGGRNSLAARRRSLTGRQRFQSMRHALDDEASESGLTLDLELVYGHCFGGGARSLGGEARIDAAAIPGRRTSSEAADFSRFFVPVCGLSGLQSPTRFSTLRARFPAGSPVTGSQVDFAAIPWSQGEQSMIRKLFLSLLGTLWAGAAAADWGLNMPRGVTELSAETYDLHMMVFWVCVAIGVIVFGVMIVSLVKHRTSKGVQPATFSHSMTAEVIWTTIPVIILLVMAMPAAETMVRLEDSRNPDHSIVVTAYQWKWHYVYQDTDVGFYSSLARPSVAARGKNSGIDPFSVDNYLLDVDEPMVVPVGAKIRLLITSNDVLHAWWVPDLAIKKDAIPGIVNEVWFRADRTGTFRGQCAELCGKDHGYMPVVVEVVEQDAYDAWIQARSGS
ncbi:MAG: cytochrome c oxidase subunit II, partial [Woeseiaceae bacterium]